MQIDEPRYWHSSLYAQTDSRRDVQSTAEACYWMSTQSTPVWQLRFTKRVTTVTPAHCLGLWFVCLGELKLTSFWLVLQELDRNCRKQCEEKTKNAAFQVSASVHTAVPGVHVQSRDIVITGAGVMLLVANVLDGLIHLASDIPQVSTVCIKIH